MSKYILVIGPTGVGKSTLCQLVEKNNANIIHIDLDKCAQVHCGGEYISRAEDYIARVVVIPNKARILSTRGAPTSLSKGQCQLKME